jgi:hypothetical protein
MRPPRELRRRGDVTGLVEALDYVALRRTCRRSAWPSGIRIRSSGSWLAWQT